jgi:hypothetical protein
LTETISVKVINLESLKGNTIMKNYHNLIAPALLVITLGVSNFTGVVGATAQSPQMLPKNSIAYHENGEVMVWADVGKVAYKVLDVAAKVSSVLNFIFGAGGEHPSTDAQLTDVSLD